MAKRNRPAKDDVARSIEEARATGATALELPYEGLTELPAAIGELRELQSLELERATN